MKGNKVTLKVEIKTLSIDAAPALLLHIIEQINREYTSGELIADDGDKVTWETSIKSVKF